MRYDATEGTELCIRWNGMSKTNERSTTDTLPRLNQFVQSLCGLYSRVARRFGVDRSYVSRVARGERHSKEIEQALTAEFDHLAYDLQDEA